MSASARSRQQPQPSDIADDVCAAGVSLHKEPEITFTQEYAVYRPKRQAVYPITESDLSRLETLVGKSVPQARIFQQLWPLSGGVTATALFTLLAFLTVQELHAIIWITTWVVLITSLVLAIVFFLVDKRDVKMLSDSADNVLDEIKFIREGYAKPQDGIQTAQPTWQDATALETSAESKKNRTV